MHRRAISPVGPMRMTSASCPLQAIVQVNNDGGGARGCPRRNQGELIPQVTPAVPMRQGDAFRGIHEVQPAVRKLAGNRHRRERHDRHGGRSPYCSSRPKRWPSYGGKAPYGCRLAAASIRCQMLARKAGGGSSAGIASSPAHNRRRSSTAAAHSAHDARCTDPLAGWILPSIKWENHSF